jgi:Condensation domain
VVKRAPLTFGQLSLWRSIQGLTPEAYNLTEIWKLPAGLTLTAVEGALEALERRHEGLRTRYEPGGEQGLTQAVWDAAPIQLSVVEADGDPDAAAHAAARELTVRGFDLAVDRSWRACAVTVEGTCVRLVVCFHHIAADAWAINQLHAEFLALVGGGVLPGTAPSACALAVEQWSAAQRNRRDSDRRFWQGLFAAAPAMHRETASGSLSTRWARLASDEACDAAGQIAARLRVSVPSVVLAAFCLALSRRTGQDKVLIAVHFNNRVDPRWRALVASQNQIVPLLVTLHPDEPFDALVSRVHRDSFRAYLHGAYNVDDVHELGAEHGYSGSVNGAYEGSVSGFFRYFFNYLGQGQPDQAPRSGKLATGTAGRNIGAPLYLQAQDGKTLTCTLRENSADTGFDNVTGLVYLLMDLIKAAGEK